VSQEQLISLETSRALEATRRFEDLLLYHVAFDDLNADRRTEANLARLVANTGRVAVVGSSGSGKSSVIASVLGPLSTVLPDDVLPLRVPVAAEVDKTVTEPGLLARHIVRFVTRWASPERFSPAEQEELQRSVAEVTRRAGGAGTRLYHVGRPLWMANAELAHQVQATGEDSQQEGSSSDAIEHLRRMVALFLSHGLLPVFVFDDSDTWVRIPGIDRTKVANAFFLRCVRMLSKELEAGCVLAIHETYLDLTGYREASKLLSGEVRVPRLAEPAQALERILHHRLEAADVGVPLGDVIEPKAVARLASYYESGRTIREVLRVAQRSLQHALSDGVPRVVPQLVGQAIGELRS